MVGLETVTYTQILPKMVNPRDIGGNAEEDFCVSVRFSDEKTKAMMFLRSDFQFDWIGKVFFRLLF